MAPTAPVPRSPLLASQPPKHNLRHAIAAHLRSEIFAGQLHPGTRIDQDALAQEVGASKIPVREALVILEREGLVAWSPFRGSYVAALTEQDVRDHFKLLGAVTELIAGELASATPSTRETVDEEGRALRASTDTAQARLALARLHGALVAAGVSERLAGEFERLTESLPIWRLAAPRQRGRWTSAQYYASLADLVIERLRSDGFWSTSDT